MVCSWMGVLLRVVPTVTVDTRCASAKRERFPDGALAGGETGAARCGGNRSCGGRDFLGRDGSAGDRDPAPRKRGTRFQVSRTNLQICSTGGSGHRGPPPRHPQDGPRPRWSLGVRPAGCRCFWLSCPWERLASDPNPAEWSRRKSNRRCGETAGGVSRPRRAEHLLRPRRPRRCPAGRRRGEGPWAGRCRGPSIRTATGRATGWSSPAAARDRSH